MTIHSALRPPLFVRRYQARAFKLCTLLLAIGLLAGCSLSQKHSTAQHNAIDLDALQLQQHGVAFISPSTITGKEEDKQTMAFIFSKMLDKERPDIPHTPLPQALGAINQAGLANEYKSMFRDYQATGIFDRDRLKKIGGAVNARYLVQLNLASFNQGSHGRFSVLGYRLFQTKHANIRMFFQIWDTSNGSIVWEGIEELILAEDTGSERNISFTTAVEESARNLIRLLPDKDFSASQISQLRPEEAAN
ncbi:hypothetical protein [Marinobacterium arenosum]|uniref:hypothetical protein n=1 Tax=Marinobacterium arenosum TaxID=2862496 RepID=UPI001C944B66|nr:hypothetical protein [Marinobacterium arenosum]MBY4677460.1 hypothetical protein [Marinobacterium arenosum]